LKVLSEEKIRLLAERNGWSAAFAEGVLDGESYRRRDATPSMYAQVGIDEYSLGFRTGYYERNNPELAHSGNPYASLRARRKSG
jgi:hypothetical protein